MTLAAMLGMQAFGGGINTLIGQTIGKQKYQGFNPEDVKDKIVISPAKAKGMVADEVQAINDQNASQKTSILQSSAPIAAKLAAIRNIVSKTAQSRGKISARVQRIQHKSMMDYYNALSGYKGKVSAAENMNRTNLATGIGQTLGSMGKTGILFGAGLLPNFAGEDEEYEDKSGSLDNTLPDSYNMG